MRTIRPSQLNQSFQPQSNAWQKLFKEFCVYIRSQNYASSHGESYITYALEFVLYAERNSRRSIGSVDGETLNKYMEYLESRPNQRSGALLSVGTIATHRACVGMLFDYAYTSGMIAYTVPFPKLIRPERSIRTILSIEEIRSLFAVCRDPRDTAILSLAYGCGLRRNEMRHLDTGDVQTHNRILYVREGKGRKYRSIPLSNAVISNLKHYERNYRPRLLQSRMDAVAEPAYLLNAQGYRLAGNHIYETITELAQHTGSPEIIEKNVTPHLLRHSIATHLIERGAPMTWVQAFLGHANPDSTHIYTKTRKYQPHLLA
ncbi:tyrosine-type recombinase/integrase [Flavobacterium sp.]|uniref:tyrosine-type recombinase/integrase n=1 Tax=Flavobacterium sp. TaxID=239 RepID=UPI0040340884